MSDFNDLRRWFDNLPEDRAAHLILPPSIYKQVQDYAKQHGITFSRALNHIAGASLREMIREKRK